MMAIAWRWRYDRKEGKQHGLAKALIYKVERTTSTSFHFSHGPLVSDPCS
jgi:hypothetical protein